MSASQLMLWLRIVSSAKEERWELSLLLAMSLIITRKSRGPSTDTWGTPVMTDDFSDLHPLTVTTSLPCGLELLLPL